MSEDDSYQGNPADWLSPKEIKSYSEAPARKATHKYNNGMIITTPDNMPTIDWLCDIAGILESHHRDIGVAFKTLCDCAEGKIIVAPVIEEREGEPIDQNLKIAAIYHQLTKNEKSLITLIIFEELKLSDRVSLYLIAAKLQVAFESLWRASKTDNIRDAIAKIQRIERRNAPRELISKIDVAQNQYNAIMGIGCISIATP